MTSTPAEPAAEGLQRKRDQIREGSGLSLVWLMATVSLIAGVLIFCHGCHAGDHDDELLLHTLDRDR
ncbi:MAG: hypothetical protein ACKO23_04215 [Gemmataceae bacterium]